MTMRRKILLVDDTDYLVQTNLEKAEDDTYIPPAIRNAHAQKI